MMLSRYGKVLGSGNPLSRSRGNLRVQHMQFWCLNRNAGNASCGACLELLTNFRADTPCKTPTAHDEAPGALHRQFLLEVLTAWDISAP